MPRPGFSRRRYPWWVTLAVVLLLVWLRWRETPPAAPQFPPRGNRSPHDGTFAPTGTRPDSGEVTKGAAAADEQAEDERAAGAGPAGRWPREPLAEGIHRIERVVDGDTLLLAGGARVRLIGVNTPETVKPDAPIEAWGPEASQFTKSFLAKGQARFTFDRERIDDYGRYLAYVWVGERLLNEELLRAGLGHATLRHPYSERMKRRFRRAQDEARQAQRGLWSEAAADR